MGISDDLNSISEKTTKSINENFEKAALRWLGVDTIEEAIEKVEDLRCKGFAVEVTHEPVRYRFFGPKNDIRITAEQTIRFKVKSLRKDNSNA